VDNKPLPLDSKNAPIVTSATICLANTNMRNVVQKGFVCSVANHEKLSMFCVYHAAPPIRPEFKLFVPNARRLAFVRDVEPLRVSGISCVTNA